MSVSSASLLGNFDSADTMPPDMYFRFSWMFITGVLIFLGLSFSVAYADVKKESSFQPQPKKVEPTLGLRDEPGTEPVLTVSDSLEALRAIQHVDENQLLKPGLFPLGKDQKARELDDFYYEPSNRIGETDRSAQYESVIGEASVDTSKIPIKSGKNKNDPGDQGVVLEGPQRA